MSDFATEYLRVKGNIKDAYTQAGLKGATLPVNQNSDNLPSTIATITGGGGGGASTDIDLFATGNLYYLLTDYFVNQLMLGTALIKGE